MARYEYEAAKWNGERVKGRVDASSTVEAKVKVRNMGYKDIVIHEASLSSMASGKKIGLQSLSLKEKIDSSRFAYYRKFDFY